MITRYVCGRGGWGRRGAVYFTHDFCRDSQEAVIFAAMGEFGRVASTEKRLRLAFSLKLVFVPCFEVEV